MKKFFRGVYDWITVIVASLVGVPSVVLQFLHFIEFVDFSPWVGPETALQIVTGVALAKALLAFLESQFAKDEE